MVVLAILTILLPMGIHCGVHAQAGCQLINSGQFKTKLDTGYLPPSGHGEPPMPPVKPAFVHPFPDRSFVR